LKLLSKKVLVFLIVIATFMLFCTSGLNAKSVTIRFSAPGSSEAEKQWCADFKKYIEAKYSGVTIEYLNIPGGDLLQKITVMVKAGDVPDLILAQDITDLVKMDALEPLNVYLKKQKELKIQDFNQGALEFSKVNGKIYSLPVLAVGYGLMVNTKLLSETGFKLENLKTWNDLLAAAKAMTKGGTYGYGLCGSVPRFTFRDFYIAAASNGLMYDKLADPASKKKFIELMKFYKKLSPYITPAVSSVEWGAVHQYIVNGKIGFLGTGTYYSGYLYGFAPDSLEYLRPIQFPKGPSVTKPVSLVGNAGYAIFKQSKNKALAWKILTEAFNKKFAAQFAGSINMTALKTIPTEILQQEVNKYYSKHLNAQMDILSKWDRILSKGGVPQPKITGQAEIERVYQEKFFLMLAGKITPEEMYAQFVGQVKEIATEYK
jgi:multiple sugar transport system substrate-binding protein